MPLAPARTPFGGEREAELLAGDGIPSARPGGEKGAGGRMRGFEFHLKI